MIRELKDAIETKGLTLPGFTSSNFAFDKTRVDDNRPHCRFFGLPNIYDFDSKNTYELQTVQFHIIGDNGYLDTIFDYAENITTAFDFCSDLAISPYQLVKCVRESFHTNRHLDIWHILITYIIEIEKIRLN